LQQLGLVLKLQVQRSGLKVPAPADAVHPRVYDPVALLEVAELLLTPDGVVGLPQRVIDVHHRQHPDSRNVDVNGVSVGFTSHYAAMRDRFGPQVTDGLAGENVLVTAEGRVDEARVAHGLGIRTRDGEMVRLTKVIAAEPCVEFTRYALQLATADKSNEQVTDGLRFLRVGTRGFYATYTGAEVVVRTGDAVFALD
jgi:hypothetical protein